MRVWGSLQEAAAEEEQKFYQGKGCLINFPVCEINAQREPSYPIFPLLASSMWVLMKLSKGLAIPWHNKDLTKESLQWYCILFPQQGALLHSFN